MIELDAINATKGDKAKKQAVKKELEEILQKEKDK